MVVCSQNRLTITKGQRYFRHPARLPPRGSVEDAVRHLLPAQGLGRLLPKDPPDRIENVTLSRPIGPHNCRNSLMELQNGSIAKRLKPLHF